MKKLIIPVYLISIVFAATASAQGNGNSAAGSLPALIERVEALEAQLAEMNDNDISDTQYVFTAQTTRFTDVLQAAWNFENVLRLQYSTAIYTFHADGTGSYSLSECNSNALRTFFNPNLAPDSFNSLVTSNETFLCGQPTATFNWEQYDNEVIISMDSGIVFDAVISDDGSVISAASAESAITTDGNYESFFLIGQTGIRVD